MYTISFSMGRKAQASITSSNMFLDNKTFKANLVSDLLRTQNFSKSNNATNQTASYETSFIVEFPHSYLLWILLLFTCAAFVSLLMLIWVRLILKFWLRLRRQESPSSSVDEEKADGKAVGKFSSDLPIFQAKPTWNWQYGCSTLIQQPRKRSYEREQERGKV